MTTKEHKEMARRLAVRGIEAYKQRMILEEDLLNGEDKRRILEQIDVIRDSIKFDKVAELEKGNRSLMESRIKWKNRYYKEKAKNKERDKYNITTLPFEELKEMIEQNKNISIFGKDYISKDKIRAKIKELEITRNSSVADNGFTIMSVVISNFKELLEEK